MSSKQPQEESPRLGRREMLAYTAAFGGAFLAANGLANADDKHDEGDEGGKPRRKPRFRAPSTRQETGPNRTVYVLRGGAPVAVPVVIGASDGRRTEIRQGELMADNEAILDQTTGKE